MQMQVADTARCTETIQAIEFRKKPKNAVVIT